MGLMGAKAGTGFSKRRGILRRIIRALYKPALAREREFYERLQLAERMDGAQGWLIVEQAMRDRALYGLSVIESQVSARALASRDGDVEA